MADVKISALPVASTLAATDILPIVQPTGTKKVALSVLDGRWLSSASGGTVNGGLTVNPYLAVGTNPSTNGVVRLASGGNVRWRNAANSADGGYIGFSPADVMTYVAPGTPGWHQFYCSGAVVLELRPDQVIVGAAAVPVTMPSTLAIGTNPASTGIVRLPNNQHIVARNAANGGDQSLIYASSADQVFVGYNSSSVVTNCTSQVITSIGGVNQVQVFDGMMRFRDNFSLDAGTTTGLRIGNGATQKLGFFGVNPVARQTGIPAAATDPATTMALVNYLRAVIINLGLGGS